MNHKQANKTQQEDALKQVQAALQRAAQQARKIAAQTETAVVIIRDGKITIEHPREMERNNHPNEVSLCLNNL